jgi:GNAT superfamily N-acetyltransferase
LFLKKTTESRLWYTWFMDVIIREVASEDYQQIIDVIKRSNRESLGKIYPPKLIEEFCSKYDLEKFKERAREIKYFIAEERATGKIAGIIGLKGNSLRTFFVDPVYQSRGIGRMLYDKLESVAGKLGLKYLILEGSPLGQPVYEKFGFKKIKTIDKERVGIHYQDAFMRKDLA